MNVYPKYGNLTQGVTLVGISKMDPPPWASFVVIPKQIFNFE